MSQCHIPAIPTTLLPTEARNSDGISCISHYCKLGDGRCRGESSIILYIHCTFVLEKVCGYTCTAIHPDKIDEFHQHLNSIEPSIQFTCDVEKNNQLPFLDVLMKREEDGSISTSVYRKPSHTDQYLQYSSHHPLSHKLSVIKTLFSRADVLSSDALEKTSEDLHITDALIENGYPRNLVQNTYRQQNRMTERTTEQPSTKVIIPYIQGQSEDIRRVLKDLDIQTCFTPVSTLRQMLSHPRHNTYNEEKWSRV